MNKKKDEVERIIILMTLDAPNRIIKEAELLQLNKLSYSPKGKEKEEIEKQMEEKNLPFNVVVSEGHEAISEAKFKDSDQMPIHKVMSEADRVSVSYRLLTRIKFL